MEDILLFAAVAIALLVALWFEGKWFLMGVHGTPEARAALGARLDHHNHWRDAATALSALAGVAILGWLWFG